MHRSSCRYMMQEVWCGLILSGRGRTEGVLLLCAEVGAVGGALTGQNTQEHIVALLSVKSIYGHTEGAAGKQPAD